MGGVGTGERDDELSDGVVHLGADGEAGAAKQEGAPVVKDVGGVGQVDAQPASVAGGM